MADEEVGSGLHHRVREGHQELRRQEPVDVPFVGVDRDQRQVRQT